jgi:hypothetical protein
MLCSQSFNSTGIEPGDLRRAWRGVNSGNGFARWVLHNGGCSPEVRIFLDGKELVRIQHIAFAKGAAWSVSEK